MPSTPPSVAIIYGLGWASGIFFIYIWYQKTKSEAAPNVTKGRSRSKLLLGFRAATFFYAALLGVSQFLRKGPRTLLFFTVWNWHLLTAYFFLATLASALAAAGAAGGRGGKRAAPPAPLARLVNALLHTELTAAVYLDVVTWLVLVPMLLSDPDPSRRAYWRSQLLCLESYNQHIFNALLLVADAYLSRQPADITTLGFVSLLLSVYGLFASTYSSITHRFIYPFLDFTKPFAYTGYIISFFWTFGAFLIAYYLIRGIGGGEPLSYELTPEEDKLMWDRAAKTFAAPDTKPGLFVDRAAERRYAQIKKAIDALTSGPAADASAAANHAKAPAAAPGASVPPLGRHRTSSSEGSGTDARDPLSDVPLPDLQAASE